MKLTIIPGSERGLTDFERKKSEDWMDDKARSYTQQDLDLWDKRYQEAQLLMNSGEHQQMGRDLILVLAEEGYPEARRTVSDFYLQGIGVQEDFLKAVEWERKAIHAEHQRKVDIYKDNFNFPQWKN